MTGLEAFVQAAGSAMGWARDSFGSGGGTALADGGVGTAPPPPPGASGQAADAAQADSGRVHGHVTELGGHDAAADGQLAAAVEAAGAGRGRMEQIIAQATADVHALGLATNTPQGRAALIAAIKRHLQDTQGTLDTAGVDASTRAAGSAATTAAYHGTAPTIAPAGTPAAMPQMGQLVSGITPLAGMATAPMQALSGLGAMGGMPMAPLGGLGSMVRGGDGGGQAMPELGGTPLVSGDASTATEAARRALSQIGAPYVWGACGNGRYDCSGLCQWAYRGVGINLPRETYDMFHVGQTVPAGQAKAGDLVFSSFSSRGPEHVQMALGDGRVVEAPTPGGHVQVNAMPINVIVKRVVA